MAIRTKFKYDDCSNAFACNFWAGHGIFQDDTVHLSNIYTIGAGCMVRIDGEGLRNLFFTMNGTHFRLISDIMLQGSF